MICWTNLTRKLTVMMRGLTISPDGAPANGQKRNLSKKPPSVIADVRPSGSAGDSATARLWIFLFRLFAVLACACLGERSEPTCIRQAHVTVPKGQNYRKLEPWLNSVKKQVIDGRGIYGIIVVKAGRLIHYAKEKHI